MSEPINIDEMESLNTRNGHVLLVQTAAIFTPQAMIPPSMYIIKDTKKVREKVGDQTICSVQWMPWYEGA